MKDWKSLSHVRWDCKYHLVFISKYRQRKIYGEVRKKIEGTGTKYCNRSRAIIVLSLKFSNHSQVQGLTVQG